MIIIMIHVSHIAILIIAGYPFGPGLATNYDPEALILATRLVK